MYNFKFVVVSSKGKTTEETFGSNHEAHFAMGAYAAIHELNANIHPGRWQDSARSVMYKGDDPMFGAVGYVAQCIKEDGDDEE
jgi:hypothetical protein